MVSHRISFDEEQLNFIREYKEKSGLDIQKFVREAVDEKIERINVEEALDSLNRLKK